MILSWMVMLLLTIPDDRKYHPPAGRAATGQKRWDLVRLERDPVGTAPPGAKGAIVAVFLTGVVIIVLRRVYCLLVVRRNTRH